MVGAHRPNRADLAGRRRDADRDAGQISAALLLAVVALLFLGLLFAQVGSASEQKTQTRTAADSAAVAAGHRLRDRTLVDLVAGMPWLIAPLFASIEAPQTGPVEAACAAAQRNWSANPHTGAGLSCADLSVTGSDGQVQVVLQAPAGQVLDGPADVAALRAVAEATAQVTFVECPQLAGPYRQALADWLADRAAVAFGQSSDCFTVADLAALTLLDTWEFAEAVVVVGVPAQVLDAVRESFRVQIVS